MRISSLQQRHAGFTLVELLVSTALIAMITVMMVSMTNSTAKLWTYTTGRSEQFRGAATGFESITRKLSQATLNTYWDYDNINAPRTYLRQSELRFIAGDMQTLASAKTPRRPTHGIFFQAPLGYVDKPENFNGLENLLNTWGYFVEYGKDTRPEFVEALKPALALRYRYRLMELMQPSDKFSLYYQLVQKGNAYSGKEWFTEALTPNSTYVHVLAENVLALIVLPKLSKAEDSTGLKLSPLYSYDSTLAINKGAGSDPALSPKNQLPPLVQVTMVALDENSARRVLKSETPEPEIDKLLDAPRFTDAKNFETDLTSLQTELAKRHLSFRVFTTNVSIRGAKWSRR